MAKNDYTAAEAVKLYIGNIEFDAIRILATNEYRMAQEQALDPIEVEKGWFNRLGKKGGVGLKTLRSMDLDWLCESVPVYVKYKSKEGRIVQAASRSLSDVDGCWEYHADNGNRIAKRFCRALRQDSLRDRFDQAYGTRQTVEQRRENDNRILDKACPWDLMYQEELREKGFSWYGSQFYWTYFYAWMDAEEKAKHERSNPVINGRRKYKIHQWIEPTTRERLRDKARELGMLIRMSQNRIQFEKNFAALYGHGYQNDLGI
jgi:hypothetical protein